MPYSKSRIITLGRSVTCDTLFNSQYLKLIAAVLNSCRYQSKNIHVGFKS